MTTKEKRLIGKNSQSELMAGLGVCFSAVALMMAGCAVNPVGLPIEARDSAIYQDQGAQKQVKEEKMRVAISVSQGDYSQTGEIAKALDSSLTSALSDFAFFTIVERSNLAALQQEKFISGEDADEGLADAADFLISAKLNGFNKVVQSEWKGFDGRPYTRYSVSGSVDFRFYSLGTKRVILTKNITKEWSASNRGDFPALAMKTAQECAKTFAQELGSRYAPPARVLEMRGDCQVAQVAFGSNYGAVKGSKVEFFDYVDNSAIIAGQTRAPRVVGTGVILSSDLTTCWVEVDNYKNVHIMRGHYVRLASDQSKGFMQSLSEGFMQSLKEATSQF